MESCMNSSSHLSCCRRKCVAQRRRQLDLHRVRKESPPSQVRAARHKRVALCFTGLVAGNVYFPGFSRAVQSRNGQCSITRPVLGQLFGPGVTANSSVVNPGGNSTVTSVVVPRSRHPSLPSQPQKAKPTTKTVNAGSMRCLRFMPAASRIQKTAAGDEVVPASMGFLTQVSHTGLFVASSSKQSSRRVVTCRNFSVQLIQSQMLLGVVSSNFSPAKGMSLLPVRSRCDGHTCAAAAVVRSRTNPRRPWFAKPLTFCGPASIGIAESDTGRLFPEQIASWPHD